MIFSIVHVDIAGLYIYTYIPRVVLYKYLLRIFSWLRDLCTVISLNHGNLTWSFLRFGALVPLFSMPFSPSPSDYTLNVYKHTYIHTAYIYTSTCNSLFFYPLSLSLSWDGNTIVYDHGEIMQIVIFFSLDIYIYLKTKLSHVRSSRDLI